MPRHFILGRILNTDYVGVYATFMPQNQNLIGFWFWGSCPIRFLFRANGYYISSGTAYFGRNMNVNIPARFNGNLIAIPAPGRLCA